MTLEEYAKRAVRDLDHIHDRLHIFYSYFEDNGLTNLSGEICSIHSELSGMEDVMRRLIITGEEKDNV